MGRYSLGLQPHRFIQVEGVPLAITDQGQGFCVVCLHAVGHGSRDFHYFVNKFSHQYRVITVDWPSHGYSGVDNKPASQWRYAELLVGLLDEMKIGACVLLGNSIGGAAAMEVALDRPDIVKGLILANPGGLFKRNRFTTWGIRLMSDIFRSGEQGRWWFPTFFSLYYRRVLRGKPAAQQRQRIIKTGREMAGVQHQAWAGFAHEKSDLRRSAQQLQCPIFFAWAAKDIIVPLRGSLEAIRKLRQYTIKTYNAGHAAFLECPESFNQDALNFIYRCTRENESRTPALAS